VEPFAEAKAVDFGAGLGRRHSRSSLEPRCEALG
jgi:hypothetical protein